MLAQSAALRPATRRSPRPLCASSSSGSGDAVLLEVLHSIATGILSPADAAVQLSSAGFASAGGAEGPASSGTSNRLACPEIVWGEGKSPDQILASLTRIADAQGISAATRVADDVGTAVCSKNPRVVHHPTARMLTLKTGPGTRLPGTVALICAGTASKQVVEEARLVLQAMGCYAFKLPESGVMGLHRIVRNLEAVQAADVVICVTGMDGGLATIVAGLVDIPVIALPTSAGYGTAFGGVTPLLAALNSSAPGVTAVNVDNGFGAAMAAWRILVSSKHVRDAMLKAQDGASGR